MLVDFWFNHFNITTGEPYQLTDYDQNVIRRHAMGRFEDLLIATATNPGMLFYLDNWLSTAPKEVVEERLASWEPPDGQNKVLWRREVADYFDQAGGLNENYGRELMELHTLGLEGGYTQQDVQEVAKAFTGWTVELLRDVGFGGDVGDFRFNPLLHVEGDKDRAGADHHTRRNRRGYADSGHAGPPSLHSALRFLEARSSVRGGRASR